MRKDQDFLSGDFICEVCGEHDLVPSKITMEANYGSQYDGDKLTIKVCGECLDKLLESVPLWVKQNKKGTGRLSWQ